MLALFSSYAQADKNQVGLTKNPFIKPITEAVNTDFRRASSDSSVALTDRSLRATLSSGEYSIANIDGSMVSIGEKIKGYELIYVGVGSATFKKDGKEITLNVSEMHKKLK